MTPDIIALAREYIEAYETAEREDPAPAGLRLAWAVLALACDRHPEAAVRCEACVRGVNQRVTWRPKRAGT